MDAADRKPAASPPPAITLRLLRDDDVAFAHELRAIAGWNQTERDWRGYREYEPQGCFIAEVAGRRAGTATTIRYEDRFGWIGMVLVHPDYRRHGVGSRLLRHAIEYLQQAGVRCVKLDATPMGRQVYVPLGFKDEYGLARYEGKAPALPATGSGEIRPLAAADFAEVMRLDAAGFGAARAVVLRSLGSRNPDLCFAAVREGAVAGYLIAREGANAVQVGPWLAREADVAEALLGAFFRRVDGRRLFIDVLDPNTAAVALMGKYGFTVQRTLTRMFLGDNAHPGEPRLVYGISSAEKG